MIQLEQEIDFYSRVNPEAFDFIRPACEDVVKKQMVEDMTPLERPKLNLDFNPFVLINNLPAITEDKKPKLVNVLQSLLNKQQMQTDYREVVLNLTGQGLIKFTSEEKAQNGAKVLNGFKLDARHILQAFAVKDFEDILSTPDQYTPLNLLRKSELELWVADQQFRNQIVYIQDKARLTLQWFYHLESRVENVTFEQPISAEQIEWSPRGTYLVVYNKDGFELWGGSQNFKLLHAFPHPGTKQVTFSTNEEFALSLSHVPQTNTCQDFILWNIRKELKVKTFNAAQLDLSDSLQFSPSSQYIARIEKHGLVILKSPEFTYLEQVKLPIPNIQNFIWVNKTNYICYAAYNGSLRETDKAVQRNQIMFYDVETKREFKWRQNQFESDRIDLFSHSNGKWVCAVLKKKIKKKVVSTIIQLANFRKIEVQMDVINEELNEEVEKVFFEPNTGKIAIQYRDKDKHQRAVQVFHYKFYAVDEGKNLDLKDMGQQPAKETNEILWSNNGTYYAFINNLKNSPDQGKLEFGMVLKKVNANNNSIYSLETTKQTNHYYMSNASWDPSGTYFITMSDQWSSIIVWSAIGEQLIKDTITKITHINWRPYPQGLLSEQEERKLIQERDEFVKRYEEEDNKVINRAEYEKEQRRTYLREEFVNIMAQKKARWSQHRAERAKLLGFDSEDKSQLVEVQIVEREEIVEQQ